MNTRNIHAITRVLASTCIGLVGFSGFEADAGSSKGSWSRSAASWLRNQAAAREKA
jgi:hypothetical protein